MTTRNPRIDVQVRLRENLSRGMRRMSTNVTVLNRNLSGTASTTIKLDQSFKQFKNTKDKLERNLKQTGDEVRTLDQRMMTFGQNTTNLGRKLTENITLPMGAVILIVQRLGAALEDVGIVENFQNTARQFGLSAGDVISTLDSAAGGTVAATQLMRNASQAMALNVARDLGTFEELMMVARNQARLTGRTVEDAFDRIVLGIGKAESELLDEIGIVIRQDEIFKDLARTLGTTTANLTKLQKQEAIRNEVLRQGNALMVNFDKNTRVGAESLAAARVSIKNATDELLLKMLPAITSVLEGFASLPTPVLQATIALLALSLVAGPLLQTFGLMFSAAGLAAKGIMMVATASGRATIAAKLASAAMITMNTVMKIAGIVAQVTSLIIRTALVATGIGALIVIIGTLAAAWMGNWFGIRKVTQDAVNFIIGMINKLITFIEKTSIIGVFNLLSGLAGGPQIELPRLGEISVPGASTVGSTGQQMALGGTGMGNQTVVNNNLPQNSLLFMENDDSMNALAARLIPRIDEQRRLSGQ